MLIKKIGTKGYDTLGYIYSLLFEGYFFGLNKFFVLINIPNFDFSP